METPPTFTFTLRPPRAPATVYDRIDIDLPQARIGNVRCRLMADKVIVYSIQVFPEYQKKGYGKAAIDMLKSRYGVLIADRVRFSARDFWERMQFKPRDDGNWEYPGQG